MGLVRGLVQYGSSQVSAKLGRCAKCIGLSLSGAVVGWLAFFGILYLWPQFPFVSVLAVVPAAFTALWVLHLITYGGRAVAAERHTRQETIPATGPVMSRRRMATVFAASVGFAALVSAIVPLRALGSPSQPCGQKPCNPSSPNPCCPGHTCKGPNPINGGFFCVGPSGK